MKRLLRQLRAALRRKRPTVCDVFMSVAYAADPAAHIADLSDRNLKRLIRGLADRQIYSGLSAEVWGMAMGEATRRYLRTP